MTFEQYQYESLKTDIRDKDIRLLCDICGLIEEYGELEEKIKKQAPIEDIMDEAGDIMWYIASFCNERQLDLQSIVATVSYPKQQNIFRLAGILKKTYRDHKKVLSYDYETEIVRFIAFVINERLMQITLPFDEFGIHEIMRRNVVKLQDRLNRGKIKGDGDNR